ncbi:MAG: hypothetical protein JO129_03710 [Candidatus Dependentiae bacterium]|nr:hypothetical protein [Candidatus Dependentiae bacterium]
MKKLTKLQISILMSVSISSMSIYADEAPSAESLSQAVQAEIQSVEVEKATSDVLADLADTNPEIINEIIKDESYLSGTFSTIRHFVERTNKGIDKLAEKEMISEPEVAKFAIEIADAQADFDKAIARQRARHKENHRYEDLIKKDLEKAELGVKNLYDKARTSLVEQVSETPAGCEDSQTNS